MNGCFFRKQRALLQSAPDLFESQHPVGFVQIRGRKGQIFRLYGDILRAREIGYHKTQQGF